ncbi:MAG: hypothetical protein JXL80_09970 [Planctomycetes bacterium]|nr:hypothetical protein [Planctomycetota bacterium]
MGFSTAEVSNVRALPRAVSADDQGYGCRELGFAEVVFQSSATGKHHQAYVDGRLAAVSVSTEDRVLVVAVPEAAAALIEVVAVDADNRLTDFGDQLSGFDDEDASRVELTWCGGRYLDDHLDHFQVYGGPAGAIDYDRPLNAEPIAALIGGENLGGFGRGGLGRGGFGRSAMTFTFVTAKHLPGSYDFEVLAVDVSGNVTNGPPVAVQATVRSFPRPPEDLAVTTYDDEMQTVTLAWSPSEDV